jgi:hypothetical protein
MYEYVYTMYTVQYLFRFRDYCKQSIGTVCTGCTAYCTSFALEITVSVNRIIGTVLQKLTLDMGYRGNMYEVYCSIRRVPHFLLSSYWSSLLRSASIGRFLIYTPDTQTQES